MPADKPNLNLCKVVMSAVALGYPVPTLLNWRGEFNRPEWQFAGSHIAKLESLLAAIDDLLAMGGERGAHEDDLALLVDAYDIWFQLPPSVLIERFHRLNAEADERIRKQWPDKQDFPIPPPKQSVIITTAKDCFPDLTSGSNPHYDYWPQSPMPADMYGPQTDQLVPPMFDPARKYRKIRPRCVNSGLIMGTMGNLRAALLRASEKVEEAARSGRQLWSDQALIAEVIGDQQIWRKWVQELGSTWDGTASVLQSNSFPSEMHPIAQAALKGDRLEFGIGLDYDFATIPPTCSAEEDGNLVTVNDRDKLKEESIKAQVPGGVRVKGIPFELQSSKHDLGPLANVSWGDVELYTDFYFGTTPVGIHHNAYVNNLKPRRLKEWWNKMWFYDTLRDLVTQHLAEPSNGKKTRPLATLNIDNQEVTYKRPIIEENLVTAFTPGGPESPGAMEYLAWDKVCQKGTKRWEDELFGDNKGAFSM